MKMKKLVTLLVACVSLFACATSLSNDDEFSESLKTHSTKELRQQLSRVIELKMLNFAVKQSIDSQKAHKAEQKEKLQSYFDNLTHRFLTSDNSDANARKVSKDVIATANELWRLENAIVESSYYDHRALRKSAEIKRDLKTLEAAIRAELRERFENAKKRKGL